MIHAHWESPCRKSIVCVDSYNDRVFKGRFYNPQRDIENFSSLTQFLLIMEKLLDEMQSGQSPPESHAFAPPPAHDDGDTSIIRRGARATFELQVLFRRHTSWQGILKWCEKNVEHSFRSALELVLLMDNALATLEGGGSS